MTRLYLITLFYFPNFTCTPKKMDETDMETKLKSSPRINLKQIFSRLYVVQVCQCSNHKYIKFMSHQTIKIEVNINGMFTKFISSRSTQGKHIILSVNQCKGNLQHQHTTETLTKLPLRLPQHSPTDQLSTGLLLMVTFPRPIDRDIFNLQVYPFFLIMFVISNLTDYFPREMQRQVVLDYSRHFIYLSYV